MKQGHYPFRCKCGSMNLQETLRGVLGPYDPSKDGNNYICMDCGASGQLHDLYQPEIDIYQTQAKGA